VWQGYTSSAMIGRKMVAEATLLVTSVKAAIKALSNRANSQVGKSRKLTKSLLMSCDSPDTWRTNSEQKFNRVSPHWWLLKHSYKITNHRISIFRFYAKCYHGL